MSATGRFVSGLTTMAVLVAASGLVPAHAGAAPNLLDNNTNLCPALPAECIPLNPTPTIVNLYWDSNWDADNNVPSSILNDFTQTLVNSSYFSGASQYGLSSVTYSGQYLPASGCPANPGSVTDWGHLSDFVLCEKHTLNLPPAIFVVYTPENTRYHEPILDLNSCTMSNGVFDPGSFFAFHAITAPSIGPFDSSQIFVVVPEQCQAALVSDFQFPNMVQATTVAATHEIVEAITDPVPTLYWIDNNANTGFSFFDPFAGVINLLTNGEAADLCDNQQGTIVGPPTAPPAYPLITNAVGITYPVAYYWSNADAACVPRAHMFSMTAVGLPLPNFATFTTGTVNLPFQTTVPDGTSQSAMFDSPLADPVVRGVFWVATSAQSFNGIVTHDVSLTATYAERFELATLITPTALRPSDLTLTPSGLFPPGQVVQLSTDPVIASPTPGDRYSFGGWTGPVTTVGSLNTVTMNAPEVVTARYVLQHQLSIDELGIPTGVPWSVTVNGSALQGPFSGWVDDGTALNLVAQSPVMSSSGTTYFFHGFTPVPPATMTAQFATVAQYSTMASIITAGLASGGIIGPGSQGLAQSLIAKWSASESSAGAGNTAAALSLIQSFICSVSGQTGKHLSIGFAAQLVGYADSTFALLSGGAQPSGC